jgi:hypothetical protein
MTEKRRKQLSFGGRADCGGDQRSSRRLDHVLRSGTTDLRSSQVDRSYAIGSRLVVYLRLPASVGQKCEFLR